MMPVEVKIPGLPDDIKVYDDAIPNPFLQLTMKLVESINWPWFFLEETTYLSKYQEHNKASWDEGFSTLVHLRVEKDDDENESGEEYIFKQHFYDTFKPIFDHFEYVFGLKYDKLKRAKVNLNTTSITDEPFEPHIDVPKCDTMTALLYLNDSDGATYIYDKKCPDGIITSNKALEWYQERKDDFKIIAKIEPKANRVVIFSGRYYHSGSRPTRHKTRIGLNINWLKG
jgi:hypothetical protein